MVDRNHSKVNKYLFRIRVLVANIRRYKSTIDRGCAACPGGAQCAGGVPFQARCARHTAPKMPDGGSRISVFAFFCQKKAFIRENTNKPDLGGVRRVTIGAPCRVHIIY